MIDLTSTTGGSYSLASLPDVRWTLCYFFITSCGMFDVLRDLEPVSLLIKQNSSESNSIYYVLFHYSWKSYFSLSPTPIGYPRGACPHAVLSYIFEVSFKLTFYIIVYTSKVCRYLYQCVTRLSVYLLEEITLYVCMYTFLHIVHCIATISVLLVEVSEFEVSEKLFFA